MQLYHNIFFPNSFINHVFPTCLAPIKSKGFLFFFFSFHCKRLSIANLYIHHHLFKKSISHFFRSIQHTALHFSDINHTLFYTFSDLNHTLFYTFSDLNHTLFYTFSDLNHTLFYTFSDLNHTLFYTFSDLNHTLFYTFSDLNHTLLILSTLFLLILFKNTYPTAQATTSVIGNAHHINEIPI